MRVVDVCMNNGWIYTGVVEDDGEHICIYANYGAEDPDFCGRFLLRNETLIEVFPMSRTEEVVGTILQF